MSFSSRSFQSRFSEMGDLAEGTFTRYAADKGIILVDYGLKRPPFEKFYKLPAFLRSTPDFLCEAKKGFFFVECKGTGGTVVKIKSESLFNLGLWRSHLDTFVFVYDSKNHRVSMTSYDDLHSIALGSPVETFSNDNKQYYAIPTSALEWEELKENTHA